MSSLISHDKKEQLSTTLSIITAETFNDTSRFRRCTAAINKICGSTQKESFSFCNVQVLDDIVCQFGYLPNLKKWNLNKLDEKTWWIIKNGPPRHILTSRGGKIVDGHFIEVYSCLHVWFIHVPSVLILILNRTDTFNFESFKANWINYSFFPIF